MLAALLVSVAESVASGTGPAEDMQNREDMRNPDCERARYDHSGTGREPGARWHCAATGPWCEGLPQRRPVLTGPGRAGKEWGMRGRSRAAHAAASLPEDG